MGDLDNLFENNRRWAASLKESDPDFFDRLAEQQKPEYLWIGCSDSRVPANEIVGLRPGEVFVHRNVANLVVHTDFNCLSVLQFAIYVLKVKHVIVCGHYGCGGIGAALNNLSLGLCDNWLRNARDILIRHESELAALADDSARHDRLCEMNVSTQVKNVCDTTVVRAAWQREQELHVHGVIYSIQDGILRNLTSDVSSSEEADSFRGA